MSKYYDISPGLDCQTPAWPSDPVVVFETHKSVEAGGSSNVTRLTLGSHAGSHVDAPRHLYGNGTAVDQLDLETLIGPVVVVEISGDLIEAPVLKEALEATGGAERILFKTKNSRLWSKAGFEPDFVGLTGDAAEYLVGEGVKLVGIDYLSIEAAHGTGAPAHKALLSKGIIIVEGLDLSVVPPGEYELLCLPLKLNGLDGAPARVVVRSL